MKEKYIVYAHEHRKRGEGGVNTDKVTTAIQEAFAECFTLQEVARLYFEIRIEVERQLEYMNLQIAKEMKENGVLDDVEE